jgi:hypothetical protein
VLLVLLLYQVIFDKITALTWILVGVFFVEAISLWLFGWRCPLTVYTERLGSDHGQITDILLPRWLADRTFEIFGVLFAIALLILLIRLI